MKYKFGSLFAALFLIGATAFGQTVNVQKSTAGPTLNNITGDLNVGAGRTLNVSAGTLTLADDQIPLVKVDGAASTTALTAETAARVIVGGRIAFADSYGADPTGASDSTAAIQAAIDSFPERGGVVQLGMGRYRCDSAIILGNNTTLRGYGGLGRDQVTTNPTLFYHPATELDFSNVATDGIKTDASATYRPFSPVIESLVLRGSGQANGKTGISLLPSTHAVGKVGLAKLWHVNVEYFETGVNLSNSDSTLIDDCAVSFTTTALLGGGSETKVMDCDFWNTLENVWLADDTISRTGFWFINNEVEPVTTTCIGVNWDTVTSSVISGNRWASVGTCIKLVDTQHIVIANQIFNFITRAVDITGAPAYIVITGCDAYPTGASAVSAYKLYGVGSSPISIVGCRAVGTYSTAALEARKGAGLTMSACSFASGAWDGGVTETWTTPISYGLLTQQANAQQAFVRDFSGSSSTKVGVVYDQVSFSAAPTAGGGPARALVASWPGQAAMETGAIHSRMEDATNWGVSLWGRLSGVVAELFRVSSAGVLRILGDRITIKGLTSTTAGSAEIITGTGDPEGAVTARNGSLFLRTDGSTGTTLYVKETGTGNTGWVAK